jgi:hypothetical protein
VEEMKQWLLIAGLGVSRICFADYVCIGTEAQCEKAQREICAEELRKPVPANLYLPVDELVIVALGTEGKHASSEREIQPQRTNLLCNLSNSRATALVSPRALGSIDAGGFATLSRQIVSASCLCDHAGPFSSHALSAGESGKSDAKHQGWLFFSGQIGLRMAT